MRVIFLSTAIALAVSPMAAAAKTEAEKVVCKRDSEFARGTRLGSPDAKTCLKRAEWRELEAQSQRLLRYVNDQGGRAPRRSAAPD